MHLDGYNLLPTLTGETKDSPRHEFFYFSDDGLLSVDRWKLVFAAQRAKQMAVWREPFVQLRIPLIFDLRITPYERAEEESKVYNRWHTENQFLAYQAYPVVGKFVATFKEFPARQLPETFSIERIASMIADSALKK